MAERIAPKGNGSETEREFAQTLSVRELLRRTHEASPFMTLVSLIGATARSGKQIEVNDDAQAQIFDASGSPMVLAPSIEVYDGTPGFIAELEDDGIITPNPYAIDFVLAFSDKVTRVATRDRKRPYRYGIKLFVLDHVEIEAIAFAHKKWRVEISKTEGKFGSSISFTSPISPKQGDSFLTFKYELLRIDRLGQCLGKLRQSLLRLKACEKEEVQDTATHERQVVMRYIKRVYAAMEAKFGGEDYRRDMRALVNTDSADDCLRLFLLGIEGSKHNLRNSVGELMASAIENTHLKPCKDASVSVTLRLLKESGSFALSDVFSAGADEKEVNKLVSHTRQVAKRNHDDIAMLHHIWATLMEDNTKNLEALVRSDIIFPPPIEDFKTDSQEPRD